MKDKGLLEFFPLQDATPDRLRENIAAILGNRQHYRERMESFCAVRAGGHSHPAATV